MKQGSARINLNKILQLPNAEQQRAENVKIDNKYLESLVNTYDRQTFLLKDIKEVNKNQDKKNDAKKEFAKQCYDKHALPKPAIVVQSKVKEEMYALTNTIINGEQLDSLASILKLMDDSLKELCLSNNNIADKHFSDLLEMILADEIMRQDL